MSLSQRFNVALFRLVTNAVFRIHDEALARVPAQGPLILVINHIHLLEIPLIYARLQPRKVHGLVLSTRWKNPIVGWGLSACGSIPMERGGANIASFGKALEVLSAGEIVIIMPEGTRSHDGKLQKGYPGVALLALKSKAPLLPVVTWGVEHFARNIKKLKRTDFYLKTGAPFCLKGDLESLDSATRRMITDEIMYQMAALLPPENRGVYTDLSQATERYIRKA